MSERRLAITIKGAVSLGAYEAGAIAETLALIAYNNTQKGSVPWYIDAMCGASAGSMTSGTVAAALVRGDTSLMRKTWVTGVSLDVLAPDDDQMSDNNILDALALDGIANQYLTCPVAATPHPALRPAPASIRLRLTLSRFAPAVISAETLNQTLLKFHEYKDWGDFIVSVAADPSGKPIAKFEAHGVASSGYTNVGSQLSGSDAWSALVQTAIASGSFPFAFAPRDLRRWINGTWIDQYFQDGGTFDNDPVGQTINIAHDIDWFGVPPGVNYDDAERRFLMIHTEPFVDNPFEVTPSAPKVLDLNPLNLTERYFPAILEESQTSGLRGIVEVNAKFEQRSRFLEWIEAEIETNSGSLPTVPDTTIKALALFRNILNHIDYFRAQIIPDLQSSDANLFGKVRNLNPAQQDSLSRVALAYDLATNLTDKTKLRPIVIVPNALLSGSGLFAFGGFLVEAMRERDYAQGAYDAYQVWSTIAASGSDFLLDPSAPAKPATAAELFPQCQDQYKAGLDRLLQRIDAMIAAFSDGVTGGGLLGGIEGKALKMVIDAIANHYVKKAGD